MEGRGKYSRENTNDFVIKIFSSRHSMMHSRGGANAQNFDGLRIFSRWLIYHIDLVVDNLFQSLHSQLLKINNIAEGEIRR